MDVNVGHCCCIYTNEFNLVGSSSPLNMIFVLSWNHLKEQNWKNSRFMKSDNKTLTVDL